MNRGTVVILVAGIAFLLTVVAQLTFPQSDFIGRLAAVSFGGLSLATIAGSSMTAVDKGYGLFVGAMLGLVSPPGLLILWLLPSYSPTASRG